MWKCKNEGAKNVTKGGSLLQVQMSLNTFGLSNSFLRIVFSHNFEAPCDNSGIHKGATM